MVQVDSSSSSSDIAIHGSSVAQKNSNKSPVCETTKQSARFPGIKIVQSSAAQLAARLASVPRGEEMGPDSDSSGPIMIRPTK